MAFFILNIFLLELLISFFVGIASSTVFVLVILRLLQPKIEISNKVCFKKDDYGKTFYFFKIVNKSIFNAYSCNFELHRREPYVVDKTKVNHRITKIELSKQSIYSIPRSKKELGYGDHAVLVRTFEDLASDIDTDNLEYVLYVSTKHGLSNLTKVATATFENSKVFHSGNFKFGRNLGTC